MKQGGVSLEEDESQISRAWKAVLRNMGFLSKALGSHEGVLSKGKPMSAWCFRKTSLAPLRVGWKGQDQGTRGPGRRMGQRCSSKWECLCQYHLTELILYKYATSSRGLKEKLELNR